MSSSYSSSYYGSGLDGESAPPSAGKFGRRQSDLALYNVAAMLACVAAGFDVRIASVSSVPVGQRGVEQGTPVHMRQWQGHGGDVPGGRSGESELGRMFGLQYTSPTAAQHHTYHGHSATRHRPSINFDIPIRLTESCYEEFHSSDKKTPFSDNRMTPSVDGRMTLSGASLSVGSQSPRKTSVDDMSEADLVLISLSPSTDKAFVEYQKQLTDSGGSSVFESPWVTTPKSTPQRLSIKFEDEPPPPPSTAPSSAAAGTSHCRSPSTTSGCSIGPTASRDWIVTHYTSDAEVGARCQAGIPNVISPPPSHRSASQERQQLGLAERPVTLDIIPRPRPHAGILKKPSPVHYATGQHHRKMSSSVCETLSHRSSRSGGGSVGSGNRDVMSSSYPPPEASRSSSPASRSVMTFSFDQQKTLLDIDVEEQKADDTKPLPAKPLARELTFSELVREFLD